RIAVSESNRARLMDSIETALRAGGGQIRVAIGGEQGARVYSEERACPKCGIGLPELAPNALSYNSPLGMLQERTGLGTRLELDPAAIVSDPDRSIAEGAIEPWRNIAAGEQE